MPTAPALPAGFSLGHSYEWGIDVNTGTTGSPAWQSCRRISAFQPNLTPITEDASTYDDFGSPNDDKTGENWSLTFTIQGNRNTATGLYPEEIEAIMARTKPSAKGEAAVLHVRYYDKPETGTPNPNQAFEGFATVGIQRANTGNQGVEAFTVTLTGKGPRTEIANPFNGWGATAPTIASITPVAAAEGELVTISGSGFIGTTDVTFDTEGTPTSATFNVISDSTLSVLVPAGTAGEVGVSVTNGTGESSDYAYTRGA
ncbi:phage tail tube protein [Demequina flava]|uniref:phage tail tube protein n=1 Tax=Demequina flava TaxID=1095025 RepID=UPI0007835B9D|nr:IPT/TIG domain-containing protein [Demequina flava]